jgi:hypothetical protein
MNRIYSYTDLEKYENMSPDQKHKIVEGFGVWCPCENCKKHAKKVRYIQCFDCDKKLKETLENDRKAVL